MKLIKTSSGKRLQILFKDWKRIGERAGWSVEAARGEIQSTRPDLDLETEIQKAIVPLERRLKSLKTLKNPSNVDPRTFSNLLEGDLKNVLLATDESLGLLPSGKISGDLRASLKRFLTTPPVPPTGSMAKLKSVARQISLITNLLGTLDHRPIVSRIIPQLRNGLNNLRNKTGPVPKAEYLNRVIILIAQMFPKKISTPGGNISVEQLEQILNNYLSTPPDSHPRESEVQEIVRSIMHIVMRSACTLTAILKFASGGIRISKDQWIRMGTRNNWFIRLAEEKRPFKIAVDFDGTIAEHAEFPTIGPPVPDAFMWLRKFQKWGDVIILFTMRSGDELENAVEYCRKHGLEFDGINEDPDQSEWTDSPKAYANIYVDDLGAGCPLLEENRERPCVDWSRVGPMIARMRKAHT